MPIPLHFPFKCSFRSLFSFAQFYAMLHVILFEFMHDKEFFTHSRALPWAMIYHLSQSRLPVRCLTIDQSIAEPGVSDIDLA